MRKLVVPVLVAVLLVLALAGAMSAAVVTPDVQQQSTPVLPRPAQLNFFTNKLVTQTQFASLNVLPYDFGEFFVTTDQTAVDGATNTVTLVLEFSNDGVNWVAQPGDNLLDANAADITTFTVQALQGKWARVRVSSIATSTQPVTLSVSAIAD